VLDLARLALLAQRRGEVGCLRHLACFFKSPMRVEEHDFFKQWTMLGEYAQAACGAVRSQAHSLGQPHSLGQR
jgi:myo-inositol-1-phosphate synthase